MTVTAYIHMHSEGWKNYEYSNTVEPLLKDTLNKGHLCYKGHLSES